MTLSKNIFLLAFSIILFGSLQSFAQDEVLFQVKFKPNKTYVTDMVNNMQMEMDFDVDSEKKKQMESSGMKLPMLMNMLQEMSLSTKTGSVGTDKRIPMTMTYDKVKMTMTMNGKEMLQPGNYVGMKIKGYATDEGKVGIDNVEGSPDAGTKAALEKMITQMFGSIIFPNKSMKIGDTFRQEVPMEMPVSGTTLNMMIIVDYTLKEVKDSQAFFDYTQSLDMNFKIGTADAKATGSGKGTMVYNMPANYITNTSGDMLMNMNMDMGEMKMKMNLKAQSSIKAKVL